ncbi:P22 coat protein-gene protein 5 [Actinopolyspora alba]|uniref:P22 coat protein-gene protein 5 n=1 Tax=Actinopolyspora alba TaxID=673379 RepID=A0A1I2BFB9_9ACTN|nr:P22 phage major capsid protein family protein [Actinopolyspora alba]SFE54759.1 P22 coat protein-gene protein 5 [Actinopolyspora alba]
MAITNFIPEVWSAQLLTSLKNSLVYAQSSTVNRNYEGEISNYGDSVRITNVVRPTVGTYTAHTDITVEEVSDESRTLAIDQSKYFAFEVDDIESRQARGGVMDEAASEAAYVLSDTADAFLATTMQAGVAASNQLTAVGDGTTGATTSELVQLLIDMKVRLDEENVPSQGRWVAITPAIHGSLLSSDQFVRADASGSTQALRNGMVGRAFGFDVLLSNNAPAGASSGKTVIAGHAMATSYAEQINNVEAMRLEKRFSDGLKGLHLYGAKVIRPTALVTCDVTL